MDTGVRHYNQRSPLESRVPNVKFTKPQTLFQLESLIDSLNWMSSSIQKFQTLLESGEALVPHTKSDSEFHQMEEGFKILFPAGEVWLESDQDAGAPPSLVDILSSIRIRDFQEDDSGRYFCYSRGRKVMFTQNGFKTIETLQTHYGPFSSVKLLQEERKEGLSMLTTFEGLMQHWKEGFQHIEMIISILRGRKRDLDECLKLPTIPQGNSNTGNTGANLDPPTMPPQTFNGINIPQQVGRDSIAMSSSYIPLVNDAMPSERPEEPRETDVEMPDNHPLPSPHERSSANSIQSDQRGDIPYGLPSPRHLATVQEEQPDQRHFTRIGRHIEPTSNFPQGAPVEESYEVDFEISDNVHESSQPTHSAQLADLERDTGINLSPIPVRKEVWPYPGRSQPKNPLQELYVMQGSRVGQPTQAGPVCSHIPVQSENGPHVGIPRSTVSNPIPRTPEELAEGFYFLEYRRKRKINWYQITREYTEQFKVERTKLTLQYQNSIARRDGKMLLVLEFRNKLRLRDKINEVTALAVAAGSQS